MCIIFYFLVLKWLELVASIYIDVSLEYVYLLFNLNMTESNIYNFFASMKKT